MIRFGVAGNPEAFYEQGGKSSMEMPKWLKEYGVDAYEYQCGRGVKISDESAGKLGRLAEAQDIALSVHAPYFVNISSMEQEKLDNTIRYILESAAAAHWMKAPRIVVHMGAAKDMTRRRAMELSKETVARALTELENHGFGEVRLCMETMGKMNQMGTLEEVMELCAEDERLLPTVDFGHLNARGLGCLQTEADFDRIFDYMEQKIGRERTKYFHGHFSRIEYTKGGEKRHVTFADTAWGPDFEPLAAVLVRRKLEPVLICESAGTQAMDALTMKRIYESYL